MYQILTKMECLYTGLGPMVAEGQFSCPCGIAVSPNNDVYVTDHYKRVQIF